MGVSNARIEVEAAGGGPGAEPLPRGLFLEKIKEAQREKKRLFRKGEVEVVSENGSDGSDSESEENGIHPALARTSVELPVTDGSALQWAAEIASVGLVTAVPPVESGGAAEEETPSSAPAPRNFIHVSSSSSNSPGAFVSLYPEPENGESASSSSSCRVSVGLDAGPTAAVVGSQWLS